MKAINVSRVSTEEQKEAGNSLPAQIERIRKYCERKGFDVAEKDIFSFDESAYKDRGKLCKHRPEIQFFYRLSVVFNLGILAGFLITKFW